MNSRTSSIRGHRLDVDRAQSYLKTLVVSSHDPIIDATNNGIVLSWNPAAEDLFGWTAREVKGMSISRVIAAEHVSEVRRMLARAGRGTRVRQFESVCTHRDGQRIDVSLNISPVRNHDGAVADVVVIVRDITRRLRGRAALVRQNRELLTYHRLSQIVLSSRSLQESYCEIADEIRTATDFPIVAIAIVDEARQMIAFHGLKRRGTRSNLSTLEYPISKTLSGVVVSTRKPLIVTHIPDHPQYRSKALRRTRAQTFAGYPMHVGSRIIGCLNLAHTKNVEVSDETGQWMEGLANYVAVLTERKRAEEELRTSREQLRELSSRTQSAVEEERKRIAREIHDRLGQELSLLQLELGLLQDQLPKGEKDLRIQTKSMTKLIDSAIRSVQKIATDLRPTLLDNLGLGAAVEWAAREFQKHTRIRCRVSLNPPEFKLDQERSTSLFRILQEALTNILRHARATRVEVHLEKRDDAVVLTIRDNGRGIPLQRIRDSKSVGLTGMRERVHPWGGTVVISGRPGRGTEIIVTIPSIP